MSKNTETVKNRLFKIREEMEELENILEWNEGCEYCNGLNENMIHELNIYQNNDTWIDDYYIEFENNRFILNSGANTKTDLSFEYCPYCGRKLNV